MDHGAERDAPAGQGAEDGTAPEGLGIGRVPPVPVRAADGRSELLGLPTGAPVGVGGVPPESVRPVRGRAHRMTRGVAQGTRARGSTAQGLVGGGSAPPVPSSARAGGSSPQAWQSCGGTT
ncbi:hypothetical protein [Streptomyces sp. NEAU-W12]|uniref:hypothetical protein n=1 Tax=Streptomyces sp. NEAU-W12 TaxID=2994668 RepID=UPI00224ADE0D|nr:hypothetical protein [Streptomyces sp. NEAU-W12]MCX2926874.1 hypothetical protein [Streptomyces sp. NEAU-W12]